MPILVIYGFRWGAKETSGKCLRYRCIKIEALIRRNMQLLQIYVREIKSFSRSPIIKQTHLSLFRARPTLVVPEWAEILHSID
jgi:hypothetical protein